eukprot:m.95332 g.95332  ORF g.95332 m.95332 type:complete len:516 (+) comp15444_c0_seq1:149-1696(+)
MASRDGCNCQGEKTEEQEQEQSNSTGTTTHSQPDPAMSMAVTAASAARTKLGGYEFYRQVLKSPKFVMAPMVDQSELPWRMLSRDYGCQLCYTPMLNSSVFVRDETYRRINFTTCAKDRPLVVQFCGNDPQILLQAARMVEDQCDAVDINFGCPQHIARRGHYGAFLAEEWDLVSSLVRVLHENLAVPVTCKIRIFDDPEKTINYAKMIQASGCQLLTVHGRTLVQKGPLTGIADWQIIKRIKETLSIPVFANGNILYYEDALQCMELTGVDGVMSAEGQLSNPAIFNGPELLPSWQLAEQYMKYCEEYPTAMAAVKGHLFRMWHESVKIHTDLRERLAGVHDMAAAYAVMEEMHRRLKEEAAQHGEVTFPPYTGPSCKVGARVGIPHWYLQPKVHDLEKDKILAVGPRVNSSASEEQHETKRQAAEVEAPKPKKPKADGWKFKICPNCTNPGGVRCSHGLCKNCCLQKLRSEQVECPGHKYFLSKENFLRYKASQEQNKEQNQPEDGQQEEQQQ